MHIRLTTVAFSPYFCSQNVVHVSKQYKENTDLYRVDVYAMQIRRQDVINPEGQHQ